MQRFPSLNGRMMEASGGCALVDETVHDGKRQSIFRSYVYPRMDQPNITVLTGALATRILFHRRRATGVEFHYQGKSFRAEATREVIIDSIRRRPLGPWRSACGRKVGALST